MLWYLLLCTSASGNNGSSQNNSDLSVPLHVTEIFSYSPSMAPRRSPITMQPPILYNLSRTSASSWELPYNGFGCGESFLYEVKADADASFYFLKLIETLHDYIKYFRSIRLASTSFLDLYVNGTVKINEKFSGVWDLTHFIARCEGNNEISGWTEVIALASLNAPLPSWFEYTNREFEYATTTLENSFIHYSNTNGEWQVSLSEPIQNNTDYDVVVCRFTANGIAVDLEMSGPHRLIAQDTCTIADTFSQIYTSTRWI